MDMKHMKLQLSDLKTVLNHALKEEGYLPKREFKDASEFVEYLKNEDTLIFDGTEQRTQRPSDYAAQKENYSGKKRPHGQISNTK
jgi:hypothetical protein